MDKMSYSNTFWSACNGNTSKNFSLCSSLCILLSSRGVHLLKESISHISRHFTTENPYSQMFCKRDHLGASCQNQALKCINCYFELSVFRATSLFALPWHITKLHSLQKSLAILKIGNVIEGVIN